MNKKCGNCGWRSDKCKNPNNPNYDQFKDKKDRCTGFRREEQLKRLNKINELVKVIASIDRKFFSYTDKETKQERIGKFEFQGSKLFWIDEYQESRVYPYGYGNPSSFSHGGTLWGLIQDFRAWIIGNDHESSSRGGLYCTHWGYTSEGMEKVREKAKEIGYIDSI